MQTNNIEQPSEEMSEERRQQLEAGQKRLDETSRQAALNVPEVSQDNQDPIEVEALRQEHEETERIINEGKAYYIAQEQKKAAEEQERVRQEELLEQGKEEAKMSRERERFSGNVEETQEKAYQIRVLAENIRLKELEDVDDPDSWHSKELKKRLKTGFGEIQPEARNYEEAEKIHKVFFKSGELTPEEKREIEEAPWYTQTISWLAKKGIERGAQKLMETEKRNEKK